jgi:hypothetical protein
VGRLLVTVAVTVVMLHPLDRVVVAGVLVDTLEMEALVATILQAWLVQAAAAVVVDILPLQQQLVLAVAVLVCSEKDLQARTAKD